MAGKSPPRPRAKPTNSCRLPHDDQPRVAPRTGCANRPHPHPHPLFRQKTTVTGLPALVSGKTRLFPLWWLWERPWSPKAPPAAGKPAGRDGPAPSLWERRPRRDRAGGIADGRLLPLANSLSVDSLTGARGRLVGPADPFHLSLFAAAAPCPDTVRLPSHSSCCSTASARTSHGGGF